MASLEELEFDMMIGDQLVTMRRSFKELLAQGEFELTIDGHKVRMPRVMPGYDLVDKRVPTRLTTIYDAVSKVYREQLGGTNPIPLLCHREHMTPVGVCRVCVVDVKGSPRLVPSCQRPIEPNMEVSTIDTSERVKSSVRTVVELLLSDYRPPAGGVAPAKQGREGRVVDLQFGEDGRNELEVLARRLGVSVGRFPRGAGGRPRDDSSLLINVDHNACILCDRCVRGCNEIRGNHVLGRMGKGYAARIAFDLDDPMGKSNCVTCGECMVSCPTGALSSSAVVPNELPPGSEAVTADDLAAVRIPLAARTGPSQVAAAPAAAVEGNDVKLFEGISNAFLQWNRSAVVRRRFRKGEIICREGEYGSTAFIMEKGRFEVSIKSPLSRVGKKAEQGFFGFLSRFTVGLGPRDAGGQQFIPINAPVSLERGSPVAVLDPSDLLFGEMTCMSHYPRSATVTALEDCTVLEIMRNVLYMLQRSAASRKLLDDVYRRRTLDSHLRSFKLFADLVPDPEQFKSFADFLRPKVQLVRVHPGQVIIRQGDKADYFYMVRSGFVKVAQTRRTIARVVNYLGPGAYFGEIGALGELLQSLGIAASGLRTATCSALDHVDLVRMDKETFLDLIGMFPQLRENVLKVARERLEADERLSKEIEEVPLPQFLEQGLAGAGNVLVLDLERCTRCDECTKACADSHGGVTRLIREGLRFGQFLVASSCRSCLDPYCLVGCPVAAIERTPKGDINIKDTCIGCGNCANNCPYGNINMVGFDKGETVAGTRHNASGTPGAGSPASPGRRLAVQSQKATTCDKCNGIDPPSCVYACPHEAAHRMDGKELLNLVKQRNAGR